MARELSKNPEIVYALATLFVSNSFWSATLTVERETEKALLLSNPENGASAWFPKKGFVRPAHSILNRLPDENEFEIATWFRRKLERRHELVLGERE